MTSKKSPRKPSQNPNLISQRRALAARLLALIWEEEKYGVLSAKETRCLDAAIKLHTAMELPALDGLPIDGTPLAEILGTDWERV